MVLLASSFDQSKYLKAEDLTQAKDLRIKSVTAEMVRRNNTPEQRPVLWFHGPKKGLVLNVTNLRTLKGAFGDDMEEWVGKLITLFPTQTDFGGNAVGALRIRIPPPKQAAAGNGSRPKGAAEALKSFAAPPEPKPALKDDLDDEINF